MDIITVTKTWSYGRDRQGRTSVLYPGTYTVGKSLPESLAARAVREGAATKREAPKPIIKPTPKPPIVEEKPKAFMGKMKGLAPENKAVDGPGNASAKVG